MKLELTVKIHHMLQPTWQTSEIMHKCSCSGGGGGGGGGGECLSTLGTMSTSGVLDCKVVRGKVDADVFMILSIHHYYRNSCPLMELTPIVVSYWTIVQFVTWKKLLVTLKVLEHLYCTF